MVLASASGVLYRMNTNMSQSQPYFIFILHYYCPNLNKLATSMSRVRLGLGLHLHCSVFKWASCLDLHGKC